MCLAVENLPRVTITSADPVNPLEVSWKSSAPGEEAPGEPKQRRLSTNHPDGPPSAGLPLWISSTAVDMVLCFESMTTKSRDYKQNRHQGTKDLGRQ
jgi:hypothetical protein